MYEDIVKQLQQAHKEGLDQVEALSQAILALSERKPPKGERRHLSASARKRISLAQKARWAAYNRKNGRKIA